MYNKMYLLTELSILDRYLNYINSKASKRDHYSFDYNK